MSNAVSTLATTVSSDALWGVFANAIPYISVVVLVLCSFWILFNKKNAKGLEQRQSKNIVFG